MFFDRLTTDDVKLSDLTLDSFADRLLSLIPGYKAKILNEVMELQFNKNTLFESLRRFQLLWRYSSLDTKQGELVHTHLKQKLDTAHPALLSNALTHCGLTFHLASDDTLSTLCQRADEILTTLQADRKLLAQYESRQESSKDKDKSPGAGPSTKPTTEEPRKKRGKNDGSPSDSPTPKKTKGAGNEELFQWARSKYICTRCGEALMGKPAPAHFQTAKCIELREQLSSEEVVDKLRKLMTEAKADSKSEATHSKPKPFKK
jgi:hypothetical protein